jgi:hypothetical protein
MSIPRFSNLIRAATPATTMTMQPAMGTSLARVAEQTRGMKVHSAVKKRCEHCKVSTVRNVEVPREPPRKGIGSSVTDFLGWDIGCEEKGGQEA